MSLLILAATETDLGTAAAGFLGGLVFMLAPFILAYLGLCVVNAMVAAEKGRNIGGVLAASIFATPFLVYLYLLAVPALPKRATRGTGGSIECPRCGTISPAGTRQCECGQELGRSAA